jgi:hypothetical protein
MPYGDFTPENNFGELSGCESNTDGPKSSARPMEFCDTVDCAAPVTMASTLEVQDKSTLNETEVIPPVITIGGQTFVPTAVIIPVVIGADDEGQPITQSTPLTLLVAQG